jgi:hypothetical protein
MPRVYPLSHRDADRDLGCRATHEKNGKKWGQKKWGQRTITSNIQNNCSLTPINPTNPLPLAFLPADDEYVAVTEADNLVLSKV